MRPFARRLATCLPSRLAAAVLLFASGLLLPGVADRAALADPAFFFTTDPCRVYDTRTLTPPPGGQPLEHGVERSIAIAGACGVPTTASSVALNVTVFDPSADGDVVLYPGDAAAPGPPRPGALPFKAGKTRAKVDIVSLAGNGDGDVNALATMTTGEVVHLILDVFGYFVEDFPPVAVDDAATVTEDDPATAIDVLANDTDADGGTKLVASVQNPSAFGGTVLVTGGGTGVTYEPAADYCNDPPGTTLDTFTYTLTPGGDTGTVTVTVTCVDDDPTAVDDAAAVGEDSGANAIDVLANDTDPDGGPISITAVQSPSDDGGTVLITNGGADLTYEPPADYCNTPPGSQLDSFTYTISPGGDTATVTVTVNCDDDAGTAVDDAATVAEDAPATTIDVLANDTDPDGGSVITAVQNPSTAGGTVLVTNAGADLTYQPAANYCNTPPGTTLDTFTYTLNGGSTATVTVTVTCIDDAPVAVDDAATVGEDSGANTIDVRANDTDVDAGPMTITAVQNPSTAGGTVLVTNAGADLTYEPAADYCNTPPGTALDTFTYELNGGSTATVTVTVNCADDAPVLDLDADDDKGTGGADFAVTFTEGDAPKLLEDPLDATITDVDSPDLVSLTVTLTNLLDAGDEVLDADVSVFPGIAKAYDDTTTPGVGVLTLSTVTPQPIADFQTVLRTVTYHNADEDPDATARVVQFVANDGSSNSNTATSTVTVVPVDDAPDAIDDAATVGEDSGANTIDVQANDVDPDGGAGSITAVQNPSAFGGTVLITNGGADLTYEPAANYCNSPPGTTLDTFTYTLTPGGDTATVTVTVTCVDDDPVAVDDAATVGEDSGANPIDVLANDTDVDGGTKLVNSVQNPSAFGGTVLITGGGTGVTYEPAPNYCNSPPGTTLDTFTYTLTPGGDTATVTVTVTCVDDDPVAVNDAATVVEDSLANPVNVLANDTDVDGGPKTVNAVQNPSAFGGTVLITGGGTGVTYEPAPNYCNSPPGTTLDTFTYTLAPGGSMATVTVTVTCVDDPPVAVADAATVNEDSGANAIDVLANDTDIDGGPKMVNAAQNPSAQGGTVLITGGGTGVTYAPALNYCNNPPATMLDTFTYTLNGGSMTTVTVTVNCVNDPPVADPDLFDYIGNTELRVDTGAAATPHALETTPSTFGVVDGDADPVEGDAIAVTAITVGTCTDNAGPTFDCTDPLVGTVHMQPNGRFSFEPAPGDTGAAPTGCPAGAIDKETFQYTLTDDGDPAPASAVGMVTLCRFERVWFVDPNAGGGGDGTSDAPLDALTALSGAGGAGDSDVAGDYIFVHDGTLALGGPLPMEANQHLIGEGVGLSIPVNLNGNGSPTDLVPAGTMPELTNAAGDAVTIGPAIPVEIVGLSLQGSSNAIDLTSTAALTGSSTLTIGNNEFRGASTEGIDVNLNGGTTGTLNLNVTNNTWDVAGTHTGSAVDVNRLGGTLNLNFSGNANLIANTAVPAVLINGGAVANATITGFSSNTVHQASAGAGVSISNVTFDAVAGGAVQQVDGDTLRIGVDGDGVGTAGMMLSTVQGNLFFDDLDVYAGTSGLTITGTGSMTFAVTPASPDGSGTSEIKASNGAAVDVSTVALDLRLEELQSTTGGSGVNLSSVSGQFRAPAGSAITKSSGGGTAFSVASSSATVNYAGALNVTSGGGVSLSSNTGATSFSGGMTLSTGANTAFSATGGGTVNVVDPPGLTNNTITTTTATAVNISGTTIGANGVTLESVNSVSASANSTIILANTGAGQFMVTGTGGAGTGGTISNKTVDAVTLNNTDGLVTLQNVIIQDIGDMGGGFDTFSTDDAIHGQQVDGGLTLDGVTIRRISDQAIHGATFAGNGATVWNGLIINNSTIENTNRFHVAGTADDTNEGMVRILGIRGTVSITNSVLQDGAEMIDFFVTGDTLNMTATNNDFLRAYKEFTSGVLASQGGHCIDVTVQSSANANVTIGDRTNDALDNDFLNCRLGSVRVAADSNATGNIDVVIGSNDFTVNDHSSGIGGDFDFPQGGVAISSQPTTPDTVTFDVVIDGNYFDEIANASGGVGQLTLAMANGTWQVLVEDNTFDTPGNAPWFLRADSTVSAKVLFRNNLGIKGFFNCPDPSCAGGFDGPGLRALADLQNGAVLDLTIIGDVFAEHDAGFDPGQTFEARALNTGGGGTLCLDLQNNQAPDGYSLEEFAGDFNLVGSGTCPVGSPSPNCQTLLGNRGNRGGANVATTNPPFVNVEVGASIDVVAGACQQPSGGIF